MPVAGVLGDQAASLFGHTCFDTGDVKATYGTGAFLLTTVGNEPAASDHGLITTVAWQLGDERPMYALEGSVAMAGALVQWLRDNLGIIGDSAEVEPLARSVGDSGGVVFVPAFSGLFAPYWRDDARGVIVGLTRFATKAHIARAALEATAYQTYDLVEAMCADTGRSRLTELRVDGGMTHNNLLMQLQADLINTTVAAPSIGEITATGAAYAAGLATGFWAGLDELRANYMITRRWQPRMGADERAAGVAAWRGGVERALGLVGLEPSARERRTLDACTGLRSVPPGPLRDRGNPAGVASGITLENDVGDGVSWCRPTRQAMPLRGARPARWPWRRSSCRCCRADRSCRDSRRRIAQQRMRTQPRRRALASCVPRPHIAPVQRPGPVSQTRRVAIVSSRP